MRYKYELDFYYQKHWVYFHNKHFLSNVLGYVNHPRRVWVPAGMVNNLRCKIRTF